jgi:hypothetical protein
MICFFDYPLLLPVGKKDKNIIGNKLIFGRFGLSCLRQAGVFPAYGRQLKFG